MNWFWMEPGDDENLYFEDGTVRKLTPADFTLEFGKYKGFALSDITDRSYLTFMKKVANERNDWFMNKCLDLRIQEL